MQEKIVIVTGASSSIGIYLCDLLINLGATVIGIYNKNTIDNKQVDAYRVDITNCEEVDNLFLTLKEKYKKIDVLINLAALSLDADIYEKTKKDFMKVLEVNLFGTFNICKHATKIMDKGIIINMASTNAINTYSPLSMDYDASKAGVINLTKNLALRFPDLKVLSLAPNYIATSKTFEMDPNYLKDEMKRVKQKKLISVKEVGDKIIEMIYTDNYISGDIICMEDSNE